MIVAYYMPHNDGTESGILDQPGQDTGTQLVDLYEVDGQIRTFATREEAEQWLEEQETASSGDDGWAGDAEFPCQKCGHDCSAEADACAEPSAPVQYEFTCPKCGFVDHI